jgi:hypothetical protein
MTAPRPPLSATAPGDGWRAVLSDYLDSWGWDGKDWFHTFQGLCSMGWYVGLAVLASVYRTGHALGAALRRAWPALGVTAAVYAFVALAYVRAPADANERRKRGSVARRFALLFALSLPCVAGGLVWPRPGGIALGLLFLAFAISCAADASRRWGRWVSAAVLAALGVLTLLDLPPG